MDLRRDFGSVISDRRSTERMDSGVRECFGMDRITENLMQKIKLKKWKKALDNLLWIC